MPFWKCWATRNTPGAHVQLRAGLFDHANTPSIVGKITETVRARPNANPQQSPHALSDSHRAAGRGDHRRPREDRPVRQGLGTVQGLASRSEYTPARSHAYIELNLHVAEEIAKVPYLERQRHVAIKQPDGRIVQKWIRRPGCSQGFNEVDELLYERDAIHETMIGSCKARLMNARDVVDAAVEMLQSDPESLLCSRPECGNCAESRAMISALESAMEEQKITDLAEEEERIRREAERQLMGDVSYFEPDLQQHSQN